MWILPLAKNLWQMQSTRATKKKTLTYFLSRLIQFHKTQNNSKCSTLFWNGGIHFQVFGLSRTAGLGYGTRILNFVIAMLVVAAALQGHDECGQAHGDTGSRGLAGAQRFGPAVCWDLGQHEVRRCQWRRRAGISSSASSATIGWRGDSAGRELRLERVIARSWPGWWVGRNFASTRCPQITSRSWLDTKRIPNKQLNKTCVKLNASFLVRSLTRRCLSRK